MDRTITVTGSSVLKIRPDSTLISLSLSGFDGNYERTLQRASNAISLVKSIVKDFGFDRRDIKTTYFDIREKYETYYEEGRSYRKFIGYEYDEKCAFSFDIDNKLLGRILYALNYSHEKPEIDIKFYLKDMESAKDKLLSECVRTARRKAETMASAASLSLKEILNIDYGQIDIRIRNSRSNFEMLSAAPCSGGDSYDIDIEPDDLKIEDSVTIVYRVE